MANVEKKIPIELIPFEKRALYLKEAITSLILLDFKQPAEMALKSVEFWLEPELKKESEATNA